MVQVETLELDPGPVGDANRANSLIVSRFYHHVTGMPIFQVDFEGSIGVRSIKVIDNALDFAMTFGDTQQTLFVNYNTNKPTSNIAISPKSTIEEESKDDPNWQGTYEDFQPEEAGGERGFDYYTPSFSEDPL